MSDFTVTIVIPVYNEQPTENESISLNRALKVFNCRPVVFIAPEGFNSEFFIIFIGNKHNNYIFKYFPQVYFKSIEGYNKLMLSHVFYSCFSNSEYILIYQLDSYVFSDQLHFWCSLDYDYIGAPWIKNNGNALSLEKFAGNGGFSLRRVSAFIETLELQRCIVLNPFQVFSEYSSLKLITIIRQIPLITARCFGFRNNSKFYVKSNKRKEDIFWACFAPRINKRFKSIKGIDAISFAFDLHASYLFKLNDEKLPFGCHGWIRNESWFWSKFIEK